MIAHLINTDIGGRGIKELYLHYRLKEPAFLERAAQELLERVDRTLIVTGFPIPPLDVPETDGPLGALALYLGVEAIGGRAEILTYPEIEEALGDFGVRFTREPIPERYTLIISVETPGRARDWRYYSMGGLRVRAKPYDGLFIDALDLGIPTIGIGDGGNEVGMGNITPLVEEYIPLGSKIGSIVKTNHLVLSAVSNWGAYGLLAQASLSFGKNLLRDWDERENLKCLVEAGIIDGVIKKAAMSVDGISVDVHERLLELLKEIVLEKISL